MKKFAVLVAVFAFAASLLCFPVSAETSYLVDLRNIAPNVRVSRAASSGNVTTANVTSFEVNKEGNKPFAVSFSGSSGADIFDFTWNFSRFSFDSSRDYTFNFLFFSEYSGFSEAEFYLLDGNSSKSIKSSVFRLWDFYAFRFSFPTDGFSGITGVRLVLYSSPVYDSGTYLFYLGKLNGIRSDGNFTALVPGKTQADKIGDKIDENTDKFINGNGTELAPDHNKDMDDKSNQMKDLENGALGGKTDEQIQQEVDNALSFDTGSLDGNASQKMSGLFDGLLVVFGVDYQSLLMLALSLGLAAFIIGRRYKA